MRKAKSFFFLFFTGKLASPWWHARHQRAPDDGFGWSGWHPDSGILLHWDEVLQHLWHQHGSCGAELQRLGSGVRGGAVPLPTWIPGTFLPGKWLILSEFHRLLILNDESLSKSHRVSLRTVHLDILALEEVYTWATVSSVNATATLTPATLRLAYARYEALDQCMADIGFIVARL